MASPTQRIHWTSDLIEGVRGRHYVVTGGNSGLGLESVRQLARHGATVTLACRSLKRGQAARAALEAELGPIEVDVRELDLSSLTSIRDFSAALSTSPIDGLLNNAGVMAIPRQLTADGFETQFGVNHLGHYALTGHLWEGLMKATSPRVVTVSSNAHKPGAIDFDDLMGARRYSRARAYAQSKLANLLFARELQRRGAAANPNFRSMAAHPGYTASNLSAGTVAGLPAPMRNAWSRMERVIAQSTEMGALPQLYALTATEVPGGAYVGPDGWQEWRGHPKLTSPAPAARDEESASRLWAVSAELTGVDWL